jgi:hypothetical protein
VGEVIAKRSVGGVLGSRIRNAAAARSLPPPSASPTPPPVGEDLEAPYRNTPRRVIAHAYQTKNASNPAMTALVIAICWPMILPPSVRT